MITKDTARPPDARPIVLSPWMAVIGGLALYGLTLHRWVTVRSLPIVAQVTGWDWHPLPLPWREEPMAPLFLAVTAPIRLLPAGCQPLALNIFTAICAALTLGLLAHSVRLLPHDRTRTQRALEIGPHGLLAIRPAFLPALFAALMLAAQRTFWQHAIAATGEMLNLLLLAFVIDCLLRRRVSQHDRWLLVSAFAYGLGDANDWAFLGYFPLYLIALVMIRGMGSSDPAIKPGFFWRMFLCGLGGHLLYLLIPLLGAASGEGSFSFLLLHQWAAQKQALLHLAPRWVVLLAAVCTLLPLFLATIRWPAHISERSVLGTALNQFMVHSLHCASLGLALVMFFDFKYSPSIAMRGQPVSFVTFYYMAALSVGYFSGYMLLVLNPARHLNWERRNPLLNILDFCLVELVWVLAIAAPCLLVWQNFPHIRAGQRGALDQWAGQMLAGLPANKAVVLSDDPERLWLLQAACQRRGKPDGNILIETESFPHREYIYYLAARYPEIKGAFATNLARLPRVLPREALAPFMALAVRNSPNYCLDPGFGYYIEALYPKPRGVVYELKPLATNSTQSPRESEADIATNQSFWSKLENGPLKPLPALSKLDADAATVSREYSIDVNVWGTELQRANHLNEAHDQFAEAVRLNPNNFIARINLEYNERLRKGDPRPVDSRETLDTAVRFYRGLGPLLRNNGPADEPGLDLIIGETMAASGAFGQAARLFDRRLQLLPRDPEAELAMAKIFCALHQPAKALALTRQLHGLTNITTLELARCEAAAYTGAQDYAAAEKVFRDAIRQDPKDERRMAALAGFYRSRAMTELREHKNSEAARHFADALASINQRLQMLTSPGRDAMATGRIAEALLEKAEVEIMLKNYGAATATLDEVLRIQPDNYFAVLNRAVAEVQLKQFQKARADYKELRKLLPGQPYLADLGLADVAAAQKDPAEEMAQLKRCMKSAPEDSSAYLMAARRLAKLQGQ